MCATISITPDLIRNLRSGFSSKNLDANFSAERTIFQIFLVEQRTDQGVKIDIAMSGKKFSAIAASMMLFTFASQTVYGKALAVHSKQAAVKASNEPKESASQLAEDRALALVEKVKEVQRWEKEFGPKRFNPKTNGRPAFNVEEHHGSVYVVNVFEDKPEQALTFARYEVNIKSGRVKKVD